MWDPSGPTNLSELREDPAYEMKGFGTIVPEILSEICEDPTYAEFAV